MAEFEPALEKTLKTEGGYVNDPDDPGGETYKGIARKRNSEWPGWDLIDLEKSKDTFPQDLVSNTEIQHLVSELYKTNYWDRVRGDDIKDQEIAQSIFDFAVNAGTQASSKLAQNAVGAIADGIIGPNTLKKINSDNTRAFLAVFALGKIRRYVNICENRKKSRKYFFGWVKRTLEH